MREWGYSTLGRERAARGGARENDLDLAMHLVDALLGQILGRVLPNGESDLVLLEGVSAKDMERGACSAPRETCARL